MSRLQDIPGDRREVVAVNNVAAAGAFAGYVFSAPFDATLNIYAIVTATATSNSSNYATITFYNAGTAGNGTASLGSVATNAVSLGQYSPVSVVSSASIANDELVRVAVSQAGSGVTLTGLSFLFVYEPK